MKPLKLERTVKANREYGKGYVLYGIRPNGNWLERWFPTSEKARLFADKRGWKIA